MASGTSGPGNLDLQVGEALYRALMFLLPSELRRAFGEEMVGFVRQRVAEGHRGLWERTRVWTGTIGDLIREALMARAGLGASPARRGAQKRNGGRMMGGGPRFEQFLSSFQLALRGLTKRPVFSGAVVLTLALGIGGSSAIFAVVNGVLLESLPFPESDRIVSVTMRAPSIDRDEMLLSGAMLTLMQEESREFESVGVYSTFTFNLTGSGDPEELPFAVATSSLFNVLKAEPQIGRIFSLDEQNNRSFDVALISDGLWRRKFGSDPTIIGRSIDLGGRAREVIGVMPGGFSFPSSDVQVWIPVGMGAEVVQQQAAGHWLTGVGRLTENATLVTAESDMVRMIEILRERYPHVYSTGPLAAATDLSPRIEPLKTRLIGDFGHTLWLVFGSVGLLLAVACANVANLFVVRAEARETELTLRRTLGARPAEILRLLLGESAVLAGLGGVGAVLITVWGVPLLRTYGPQDLYRLNEVTVGGPVFLWVLVLTVLSALVFAALPAANLTGGGFTAGLRGGGTRGATAGRGRSRFRQAMLAGQVALALVLLVGSGLMLRTFQELRGAELGLDATGVLTARVSMPPFQYRSPEQRDAFQRSLIEELRAVPGVTSAGWSSQLPFADEPVTVGLYTENLSAGDPRQGRDVLLRRVSPDYLQTIGVDLRSGRWILETDQSEDRPVAIVTAALAEVFWPGTDPIGRRIGTSEEGPWVDVVGVVQNVLEEGVAHGASEAAYFAAPPMPVTSFIHLAIKAQGDPVRYLSSLQSALWRVDADLPVVAPKPMDRLISEATAATSFAMMILLVAGLTALFLGAIGVYGVVSHWVNERARELSIRVAIGAEPADVTRTVLARGLGTVAIGIGMGLVASLALAPVMEALLFGVTASDPVTFAGAGSVLLLAAVVAMIGPTRRALGSDPMTVLRTE